MPKSRKLVVSLAVVTLAGCATGPDYRPPIISTGDDWIDAPREKGPMPDLSRWWTTFNDPTLERLIKHARLNNRNLRQTITRVTEARALLDAAVGGRYPDVDVLASTTARRQSENGPLPIGRIPGLERDQTIHEAGFDAAWEAGLFGRTRYSVEAAEARLGEAIAREQAAQLTVAAEVARTYLSLRGLQRERAAQEAAVRLSQQTVALVRRQYELGEAPEASLAQAEAELASLEARLPLLDAEIRSLALALGVLLGELPETELAVIGQTTDYPTLSAFPVGERADLLRRRPDVRAAERRLATATAEVGMNTAELYPRLIIGASGGFQALDAGDLLQSASQTWSLAPLISWRVFAGGRIRAHIRASEARARVAALEFEQAVLTALADAERALARYRLGLVAIERHEAAVAAARRNLELARVRYRAGDTALLALLDAERALRHADIAYARTHRTTATALVALYKALGGGWQVRRRSAPLHIDARVTRPPATDESLVKIE